MACHRIELSHQPRAAHLGELPALTACSLPDADLVAEFLDGETAAVETIVLWVRQAGGRYRNRLRAEWDDLLQDLLLRVTTVLQEGAFRGECQLRTFVWRIVHNRCLNRLRDLARRPEAELGEEALRLPDPARPVLALLVERESEDRLRRFLEASPADCRRLWGLILAGRSYREISRETGVSEGALRVRVMRCRQRAVARWESWIGPSCPGSCAS